MHEKSLCSRSTGITMLLGVSGCAQLLAVICFKGKARGKGLRKRPSVHLEARKCSAKTSISPENPRSAYVLDQSQRPSDPTVGYFILPGAASQDRHRRCHLLKFLISPFCWLRSRMKTKQNTFRKCGICFYLFIFLPTWEDRFWPVQPVFTSVGYYFTSTCLKSVSLIVSRTTKQAP